MTTKEQSGIDDRAIKTLRAMAWARAKGELNSVLQTFWDDDKKFPPFYEAVKELIQKVEDEGLAE